MSLKTPANTTDEAPVTDTLTSPTSLVDLLRGDGIRAVYQPIVDLGGGETAAYESLVRGPAGSTLESPAKLFDEARIYGLSAELDQAARRAAIRLSLIHI